MSGKLLGEKGYIWDGLFERLFKEGIEIVSGLKWNMKKKVMGLYEKIVLGKRCVIERMNEEVKNVGEVVD